MTIVIKDHAGETLAMITDNRWQGDPKVFPKAIHLITVAMSQSSQESPKESIPDGTKEKL